MAPSYHSPTPCPICGKVFTAGKQTMQRHMNTLHNPVERPFKCEEGCVQIHFKTQWKLTSHYQMEHKIRPPSPLQPQSTTCTVCQKYCVSKKAIREHMRTHTEEKAVWRCCVEGCGDPKFATEMNLLRHMRDQHTSEGAKADFFDIGRRHKLNAERTGLLCRDGLPLDHECPNRVEHSKMMKFDNATRLHQHMWVMHRDSSLFDAQRDRSNKCKQCKQWVLPAGQALHSRRHIPTPFRCFECKHGNVDEYFESEEKLQKHIVERHIIEGEGEKTIKENEGHDVVYKCEPCNRQFKTRFSYERHMKERHRSNAVYSHPCEMGCPDIFFATRRAQGVHYRDKHGKPFEQNWNKTISCYLCPYTTEQPDPMVLERHMESVHSPVGKPFKCEEGCRQTYFVNKAMHTLHNRRVHEGMVRRKQAPRRKINIMKKAG